MNDENDVWTEELEAYVEAYAQEERSGVDAAAAFARFDEVQQGAPISLDAWKGRRRAVVFAVVGAALAAGLAGVWISNGRSLQLDRGDTASLTLDAADSSSQTQEAVSVPPPPLRTRRAALPGKPEAAAHEPEPAEESLVEPVPAPPPSRMRRPSVKPSGAPAAAPAPPSALARELSTLSSIRKAARSRDYTKALNLVGQHREEFPKPTLAAERDLIEIEALCGLGRVSQASDAKEAFAKAHPTHHLRAKAEQVCGKKSERAQNSAPPRHQGE